MARLPTPGGDSGNWGSILNDFLKQSHTSGGQLKSSAIQSAGGATDVDVVHKSGSETISGTKTYTSSPKVPTPTTTTDAANKDYVDTVALSLIHISEPTRPY